MTDFQLILGKIHQTLCSLPDWNNLEDFVDIFYQAWLQLGNFVQQQLVQGKIEELESQYSSPRSKREKRYYTPLGEMTVKRRVYDTSEGLKSKIDRIIEFPENKWLSTVLELACALGVSSEFPNAHRLFQKYTNIQLTEKTLANQVEKAGNTLQTQEFSPTKSESVKTDFQAESSSDEREDFLYVGVDGVMTPLNQKQGYKEAKVGVIFWKKHHQKTNGKRATIRQREYVATLKSRGEFRNRVSQLYQQIREQKKVQTVVIGDGAHWIWEMGQEQFPGAIEILDFYHLSEYVWVECLDSLPLPINSRRQPINLLLRLSRPTRKVAKAAWPYHEEKQKKWVEQQQLLLKKSQWKIVIENCNCFKRTRKDLTTAITSLKRYLTNNKARINYQSYLNSGLMIGSGVVESSNRRVVTQRLKQAGMHWSKYGAEGVMALRAAYLSNSTRWSNFWSNCSQKLQFN